MIRLTLLLCLLCGSVALPAQTSSRHRTTLSLDGQWDVADSVTGTEVPATFTHRVPVPGLTHSALPAFPEVDEYQSRQLLSNLVRQGRYPAAEFAKLGDARGISHQKRNYFWYRTTFTAPAKNAVALLTVGKAQFSMVAYLNGERIGEHDPCFTSATFNVTKAIKWNASNELIIRIGAHPGVLPPNVSEGTDFEKNRWTPGIYDRVSLAVMGDPVISNVQAAPKLETSSVLVQTELHNFSDHAVTTRLRQQVLPWKSQRPAAVPGTTTVTIPANGTKTVQQTIAVPHAHLWTPNDPFLYQVVSTTPGDDTTTRFGMREFHFDTITQRAYLNGKPYFLRGSNITLHRFFEDPDSGTLPWDEAWLHRLLVDLPKQLHWNAFRFCIGPVPERWLEIADENGLLIENEYMVWTGHPSWSSLPVHYDNAEMIQEYTEWMRDNWNHPSVAIWDATNESWLPQFTDDIIPAVRDLDLSRRPWENSYNAPAGPNDPVEDHQYLFINVAMAPSGADVSKMFKAADMEEMLGPAPNSVTSKTGHPMILNEYGWLWLNRDGSPTLLTERLYPRLLGKQDTTENRFALQNYLLGGETEFWRAYRHYAGVLHFVYLTASDPKGFTSDHFLNVKTLQLEPHFVAAMEQAFNPLGVYLNFWQPTLPSGQPRFYTIAMVNDESRPRQGKLRLHFVNAAGTNLPTEDHAFLLPALGAQTYTMRLAAPDAVGDYTLEAEAIPDDAPEHPTISRRKVSLVIPPSH